MLTGVSLPCKLRGSGVLQSQDCPAIATFAAFGESRIAAKCNLFPNSDGMEVHVKSWWRDAMVRCNLSVVFGTGKDRLLKTLTFDIELTVASCWG